MLPALSRKSSSVSNSAGSSSPERSDIGGQRELGVLVISGQQRQVAVDPKAFPRRAGAQVRDGPEHLKHGRGLCVGIVQVQHVHLRADADPQVRIEPRTGYAHKGAGVGKAGIGRDDDHKLGRKVAEQGGRLAVRGGEFPELLTQEGQLAVLAARPFAGCRAKRPVFPVRPYPPLPRQDGGGP